MINLNEYEDIINLPRPESLNRKRMDRISRASQFAPFAALVGYEESINEAKRIVDRKILLTNEEKEDINNKLNYLKNHLKENILVTIEYFVKDLKKDGGKYISVTTSIKKIDEFSKIIHLIDKTIIKFSDIKEINIK